MILSRAQLGFLSGRAVLAQRFDSSLGGTPSWEEREWDIPDWFWEASLQKDKVIQDWATGRFEALTPAPVGSGWVALAGVHFLADSLQALLPPSEAAPRGEASPAEMPTKDKPGGRPPAAWWDDMWCDVWGLIYEGTLNPKTQAAIEDAMHSWAQEHGHNPAESTVRAKARKFFRVLKRGENPRLPSFRPFLPLIGRPT